MTVGCSPMEDRTTCVNSLLPTSRYINAKICASDPVSGQKTTYRHFWPINASEASENMKILIVKVMWAKDLKFICIKIVKLKWAEMSNTFVKIMWGKIPHRKEKNI